MIDLNTIINTALTAAIEKYTLPLQRTINAQEEYIIRLSERLAVLEQKCVATPLTGTVDWANSQPAFDAPAAPTEPAEKTILNDIDTLKAYIASVAEQAVEDGIEMHCNEREHNDESDIDSWIERIMERHESDQHDDGDSFEEKVREALRSIVRNL